jgi:hypothetical protein
MDSPVGEVDRRWRHPYAPEQIVSVAGPCHGSLLTVLQMIDSGKIASVSEATVIQGSQLIFHMGEWTSDGEHVRSLF